MQTSSTEHGVQRQLIAGLRRVDSIIRMHRFVSSCRVGVFRSMYLAAALLLGLGICNYWLRAWSAATLVMAWSFGVSVASLFVVFAIHLLLHLRPRPNYRVAAELLDLNPGGHNRIATALELASVSKPTPFERAAIAAGLDRLKNQRDARPILPTSNLAWRRPFVLILLGLAFVALFSVLPLPQLHAVTRSDGPAGDRKNALIPPAAARDPAVESAPQQKPALSVNPDAGLKSPADPETVASADEGHFDSPGAIPAQNMNSSRESKSAGIGGNRPPQGSPSSGSSQEGHRLPIANENRPDSSPSPPNPGLENRNAKPAASSASGNTSPDSNSRNGEPNHESTDGSGDQGGQQGQTPKSAEGGKGGSGASGDPHASAQVQPSKSSGSAVVSAAPGGDGQKQGQNQPKKSRGVMPLFFGTIDPDFILGAKLDGPEDRANLSVRPVSDPLQPSTAASVVTRTEAERCVDRYVVRPEMLQSTTRYFSLLHGTAEHPAETTHDAP